MIRPFAARFRFLRLSSAIVSAGLALAGCGGHHGSSTDNNTTLTAIIHWPALSTSTRQVNGISGASTAAQVCIITTTSGNTDNGDPIDFTPIIRNPANVALGTTPTPAYTDAFDQVWNSDDPKIQNPGQVRRGSNGVQVRFYAQLPTGTSSGVANDLIPASYAELPSVGDSQVVQVDIEGATYDLGTLGPITVTPTIKSVLIAPLTVSYGNAVTIPVLAYDASGTLVAPTLQTGAATFTQSASSSVPNIAPNGTVTANGLGSTTVTASIDGATSNTVTITSTVGDTTGYHTQGSIQFLDAAYSVIAAGSTPAAAGSNVSVTYTGYFSNDPTHQSVNSGSYTAFDTANATTPLSVTIGSDNLVGGLDAGLVGMGIGDQRIIIVPSSVGLGANAAGTGGVPANATLIYIVNRTN